MTSIIQRQAVQFHCFSSGLEKCLASQSPKSYLDIKPSAEAGLVGKAVFHDFSDSFSKSSFTSVISLFAMDGLETSLSPLGAASFIPEI